MPYTSPFRARLLLTSAVALAEVLHLTWEHLQGGVVSHHLLNRPDLPAISNWWGLVVLPALAWFLIGRIQARGTSPSRGTPALPVAWRFLAALLYGAGLAMAFALGYEAVTSAMFFGLFALAVVLPIFRAEYFLGFVLGMTFVFGAVLPTLIACIFALLSAVLHPLARSIMGALAKLASRTRRNASDQ